MAHGNNRRNRNTRRDNHFIANHRLPLSSTRSELRFLEDMRTFYPNPSLRPALAYSTRPSVIRPRPQRVQTRSRYSFADISDRMAFVNPSRVLVCVRRKVRKEVLHAFRKTGKVGQKRPRFNAFSGVHC